MLDYRLMTNDDYEEAYDLWLRCGNGLNDKDDSREGIENILGEIRTHPMLPPWTEKWSVSFLADMTEEEG